MKGVYIPLDNGVCETVVFPKRDPLSVHAIVEQWLKEPASVLWCQNMLIFKPRVHGKRNDALYNMIQENVYGPVVVLGISEGGRFQSAPPGLLSFAQQEQIQHAQILYAIQTSHVPTEELQKEPSEEQPEKQLEEQPNEQPNEQPEVQPEEQPKEPEKKAIRRPRRKRKKPNRLGYAK